MTLIFPLNTKDNEDTYWQIIPSSQKQRILAGIQSISSNTSNGNVNEGEITPLFTQRTKSQILSSANQTPSLSSSNIAFKSKSKANEDVLNNTKEKELQEDRADGTPCLARTCHLTNISENINNPKKINYDKNYFINNNYRKRDLLNSSYANGDDQTGSPTHASGHRNGLPLLDPSTPVLSTTTSQINNNNNHLIDNKNVKSLEDVWSADMQSQQQQSLSQVVVEVMRAVSSGSNSSSSSPNSNSSTTVNGSTIGKVRTVADMIANMKMKKDKSVSSSSSSDTITADVNIDGIDTNIDHYALPLIPTLPADTPSNSDSKDIEIKEEETVKDNDDNGGDDIEFDDDLGVGSAECDFIHNLTQNFRPHSLTTNHAINTGRDGAIANNDVEQDIKKMEDKVPVTSVVSEFESGVAEGVGMVVTYSQMETETKAIERLLDIDCFSMSMSQSQSQFQIVDQADDGIVEYVNSNSVESKEDGKEAQKDVKEDSLGNGNVILSHPVPKKDDFAGSGFTGFASASGKQMKPLPKEAIEKAKLMFDDSDHSIDETTPVVTATKFTGFASASGKQMKPLSEKAIEKAKLMFYEDDLISNTTATTFTGFASASGKQMKPLSKEAIEKAKLLLDDNDKPIDENNPMISNETSATFGGFASASGKQIKPLSKEAIEKAKLLFDDKAKPDDDDIAGSLTFGGFASASGKQMKPLSEEAIEKAKLLFDDRDKPDHEGMSNIYTSFTGLASASGKQMMPMGEAHLEKTENLFGDDGNDGKRNLSGFTSASGKTVKPLGKEALENAKLLFEQDQFEIVNPVVDSKPPLLKPRASSNQPTFVKPQTPTAHRKSLIVTPRSRAGLPKPSASTSAIVIGHKRRFSTPFVKPSPIVKKTVESPPDSKKLKLSSISLFDLTPRRDRLDLRRFFSMKRNENQLCRSGIFADADIVNNMNIDMAREIATRHAEEYRTKLIDMQALEVCATPEWISNHLAIIFLKVCCYLRNFPQSQYDEANEHGLLKQLAYRYEREVNQSERSIIKKICERDDVSTHDMILAVQMITRNPADGSLRVILSDGWYTIPTIFDKPLQKAIDSGKISVGSKLHVFGCQLSGGQAACSPLDPDESKPALAVSANCCRLVGWDCKLGRTGKRFTFQSLNSISSDGGLVPAADVIVLRQYPFSYLETRANVSDSPNSHPTRIVLNSQEEYEVDQEYQRQRQREVDGLLDEHARQQSKSSNADCTKKAKLTIPKDLSLVSDPDLLNSFVEQDSGISAKLTQIQIGILQDHITHSESSRMESIQRQVIEQVDSVYAPRNSRPFLRLKVADYQLNTKKPPIIAFVTLWNPQPEAFQTFAEGKRVLLRNVMPSSYATHDGHLQLSSGKFSSWKACNVSVRSTCGVVPYMARDFTKLQTFTMRKLPETFRGNSLKSNEDYHYDIVVLLVHVEPFGNLTRIFVTDSTSKLAVITLKSEKYSKLKMYTSPLFHHMNSVIFFSNVRWTGIDKNVNLILFESTDETIVSVKSHHLNAQELKSKIGEKQNDLFQTARDYIMSKVLHHHKHTNTSINQ